MNISYKSEQALIEVVSAAVSNAGATEEGVYELTLPNGIPAILVTEFDQQNWGKLNGIVYIRPEAECLAVLEKGSKPLAQASFTVSIRRIPSRVSCAALHIGNQFAREWKAINV